MLSLSGSSFSPFASVTERFHTLTKSLETKLTLTAVLATKKFTKLWRHKTAERKSQSLVKSPYSSEQTSRPSDTPSDPEPSAGPGGEAAAPAPGGPKLKPCLKKVS